MERESNKEKELIISLERNRDIRKCKYSRLRYRNDMYGNEMRLFYIIEMICVEGRERLDVKLELG